jgi:hypothetical protein
MAEIPNRDVVFPAWATIVENLSSRKAEIFTPQIGRLTVKA